MTAAMKELSKRAVTTRTVEERLSQLERIVNQLDRDAESLEAHVEIMDGHVFHFRWTLQVIMEAIWSKADLESKKWDLHRDAYQKLFPEWQDNHRQCPAWWSKWRRPERRTSLYGSRVDLLALAKEHEVKVNKRLPRDWIVRDLLRAGVQLPRKDATEAA